MPFRTRLKRIILQGIRSLFAPIWDPSFAVMNRFERFPEPQGEAEVRYLDGEFRILRPGSFVRCGVTNQTIPLDELRYWSVDLQEAYADPQAVLARVTGKLPPQD